MTLSLRPEPTPMDIAIIDSNSGVAAFMIRGLREEGYAVDWFDDCRQGLYAVLEKQYGLLIVGSCQGAFDAAQLCARLRQSAVKTPILIVSASNTVIDRVRGLDAGADDFIGRPFALEELLARVPARQRRHPGSKPPSYRIDDLELDSVSHKVRRAGR